MKKISVLFVSLAALFIFAGCSDSPKDVAVKWCGAMADGNLEKANEYSTAGMYESNRVMVEYAKKNPEQLKSKLAELKKAEEQIDGDSAKLLIDGSVITPALTKVDGKWKVDVTEKK